MNGAIESVPGKGIKINLDDFQKLKAFQAGGEFWEHQSQSVIREYMGEFLPLMNIEEDGKSVLCQMFVEGKEVASTSRRSTGIPSRERARLLHSIERLKSRAASPDVDSSTRAIIEAFMLPDPRKDPELYRLYGSRWKPHLIVIWGCEKEEGSSVVPTEAGRRVGKETTTSGLIRRLPILLLLLGLLAFGLWALQREEPQAEAQNPVIPLTESDDSPPAIGPDGKPILGPDGKPLPARPDGLPIALDSDGNPILDPEGNTLPARPDGKDIALDEDGQPILSPDGETFPAPDDGESVMVDDNGQPIAVDSKGNPILGPDGKPLPARPDGKDIALDENGQPILSPDGETFPTSEDDKPIPVDESGQPIAVDSDGQPVLGPDDTPLPARPDGQPIAIDSDGQPILDPDGNTLPARPDGKDIALDEEGLPILSPDGETFPTSEDDKPTPVDEEGQPIAIDSDGEPILGPDGEPLPARPDGQPIAVNADGTPILNPEGESFPAPAEESAVAEPIEPPEQETEHVLVLEGPMDSTKTVPGEEAQRPSPRRADGGEVNLAKRTRPAVVTIAVGDKKDDFKGQGTGFLITSDGLVVTNNHVVEGGIVFVAILADGSVRNVEKIVSTDKARDLAILRIQTNGRKLPFLRLSPKGSRLEVGSKIAVMGSPQGLAGTFTTGIVSARRTKEGDVNLVQITAPVSPGSSGSPVVNHDASVVAVVTGGIDMTKAQALNFAVDVGELYEILDQSGAAIASSVAESEQEEASNERNPKSLPPSAAVGRSPKEGGRVDWPTDPAFEQGDRPAPPNQAPIKAAASRIELKEIGRDSLDNGKIRIRLESKLRNANGPPSALEDLQGTLGDTKLVVEGSTVVVEAVKGVHQLAISGKDHSGKMHSINATIEVGVEVKATVEIKVKQER